MRDNYQRTRDRRLVYARERKKMNPALVREQNHKAHLKRAYGMTLAEYQALLTAQDGRCAVCGSDQPGSTKDRWHVDHCHDTGMIRGLLCAQCNVMIAMARDDETILQAAIGYLRKGESDAAH
jgi:hypothetical protein